MKEKHIFKNLIPYKLYLIPDNHVIIIIDMNLYKPNSN